MRQHFHCENVQFLSHLEAEYYNHYITILMIETEFALTEFLTAQERVD
jgi:hypothetical protein